MNPDLPGNDPVGYIIPGGKQTTSDANQGVFVAGKILGFETGLADVTFDPSIGSEQNDTIGLHRGKNALNFDILGVQTTIHQLIPSGADRFRQGSNSEIMNMAGINNRSKQA